MVKIESKLGQNDFLVHFESFFVHTLVHLMKYTPRFCQFKDFMKIYIYVVRFIRIIYVVVKSKVFKNFGIDSAFSIYKMASFSDFLVPYPDKYCLILLEI